MFSEARYGMANPRGKLSGKLSRMLELFSREEDWLILINADPDAMASAMALKRIMSHRVGETAIARINAVTRPDNLAMVRFLHIPVIPWDPTLCAFFHRFALVDSQPQHSPDFQGVPFSLVVDHHPVDPEHPVTAAYTEILPEYGATGTIFSEYLRALNIRPGALLATALQYAIRTDTATFTRKAAVADMRAYQYLAKYADNALLTRIMRSEYLLGWLKYFSRAFNALHRCGSGCFTFAGCVENPDILVVVADFFTRVHGLKWIAVSGVYPAPRPDAEDKVVVIFRGSGHTDLGRFAAERLGDLGSAGGHRSMARAEFPVAAAEGRNLEVFVFRRLSEKPRRPASGNEAAPARVPAAATGSALPSSPAAGPSARRKNGDRD